MNMEGPQTVEVRIPDGLKAGDRFDAAIGATRIQVTVPPGYRGGQKMAINVDMRQSQQQMQKIQAELQRQLADAGEGCVSVISLPKRP